MFKAKLQRGDFEERVDRFAAALIREWPIL
jgi:hypothetical protein